MRVFAGPNGSGKSTLKSVLRSELLGVYVNADEMEQTIRERGCIELSRFNVDSTGQQAIDFLSHSPLLRKAGVGNLSTFGVQANGTTLMVDSGAINAYLAAAIAGFIREELLRMSVSFTFETVMSSPDKVELMRRARQEGFRVYLYYIATSDPEINKSRVQGRVASEGTTCLKPKLRVDTIDPWSSCTMRFGAAIGPLYSTTPPKTKTKFGLQK